MSEDQRGRPVRADNEAKGRILEDVTEKVLDDLGVSPRRNKVNGKGPDFKPSLNKKLYAIENKHWADYEVGLSCVKKEVISRFKRIRSYRRIVIASHLKFKPNEANKIDKALTKAKIKIVRLGFEITSRKTWKRAYRIIRRLTIRLLALRRFLHELEVVLACSTVIAEPSRDVVLPGDDVKWLN